MSEKVRLYQVVKVLSAKERGLLVLRSWKEGKDEDPSWRATMPPEQTPAFNRYIGLMNAVNRALGLYLLHEKVISRASTP